MSGEVVFGQKTSKHGKFQPALKVKEEEGEWMPEGGLTRGRSKKNNNGKGRKEEQLFRPGRRGSDEKAESMKKCRFLASAEKTETDGET